VSCCCCCADAASCRLQLRTRMLFGTRRVDPPCVRARRLGLSCAGETAADTARQLTSQLQSLEAAAAGQSAELAELAAMRQVCVSWVEQLNRVEE
jgi:hypothetical protein